MGYNVQKKLFHGSFLQICHPKSTILGQMTNLNMIFHVAVFID